MGCCGRSGCAMTRNETDREKPAMTEQQNPPGRHEFDRMLGVKECSRILGIPAKRVLVYLSTGYLKAIRYPNPHTGKIMPGSKWHVFSSSLAKFLGREVERKHRFSAAELERRWKIAEASLETQRLARRRGRVSQ